MSLKTVRYVADRTNLTQAGAFRANVRVPSYAGIADLSNSRLVMDMTIQCYLSGTTTAVLLPCTFGNMQSVGSQVLVNNTKVISDKFGLINERTHQNIRGANLGWYTKDRTHEDELSLFGNSTTLNYGIDPVTWLPDTPFFDYVRPSADGVAGTTNAQVRRAEIPVAWHHIDNCSSIEQFPYFALGDINYQIEFENQLDTVYPCAMPFRNFEQVNNRAAVGSLLGDATSPLTLTKTTANFFREPRIGDAVILKYVDAGVLHAVHDDVIENVTTSVTAYVVTLVDGGPTTGATDACTSIYLKYYSTNVAAGLGEDGLASNMTSGATSTIGSATAPLLFDDIIGNDSETWNRCPFYVGAPVEINASNAVTNAIYQGETTISSITINAAQERWEIVLATPLNVGGAAAAITQIYLGYRDSLANTAFTVTWEILKDRKS